MPLERQLTVANLVCAVWQELELAVVREQAALAAGPRPAPAASPLRGVRPAALAHVEALRRQATAADTEARPAGPLKDM